ncbi:MAG: uroporphyrinogen-III C-methyltransferase [Alphaproteobacteria bacterium]|nr:uroporphyrinogen-III C-methyltransferase [Alphaproteobacteria bacterium]
MPALKLAPLRAGEVWLVGAGPGDPGLLTLHAVHALRAAEVIVHDALVGDRILALAAPGALLEYVGKRGGTPSCSQGEITERLVAHARRGRKVVRLKGGDPFVFGRGGEEALALAEAGIPFRVVPGVTAGIGGLAYAGIPVTTRETNHAVTFVTGHAVNGTLADGIDWDALARGAGVLVFYMGMRTAGAIAAKLMGAGRAPDEPVAVVARATSAGQRVLVSTLAHLEADLAAGALRAPAVIVVGEVVRLREKLDWLSSALAEDAPDAAGIRAALTRPAL